jgi:outer membrane protein assembly factor BamB
MTDRQRLLLCLALTVSLGGCSYMPAWMGGKKTEKPRLPGERIAVLPIGAELKPDASLTAAFTLPPATANADWPQHSGNVTAATANLAIPGNLNHVTHATAGDGNEFTTILLPRPVTGGGMVYAMDARGYISAHDAGDIAKIRWHTKGVYEKHGSEITGGGLAFDEGKVYATSGHGVVTAIDAATGKELWRKNLHVPFASAPVTAQGKLFATTLDNQLYAIDTASGEVLWTQRGISETARMLNTVSPALAGAAVIVPYSSGELSALSVADGREAWSESLSAAKRTQANALFTGIGGDPVIDGSVVFAVSNSGMFSVLALPDGHHLWDRPIGSLNTPWVTGDYLFLLTTDNTVLCLYKYDGRIRWSTRLASYEDEKQKKRPIVWHGPVMVNGQLAIASSNGQLALLDGATGKLAVTKTIPDGIYTPPVVAGGKIYLLGQDATLYAVQ